MVHCLKIVEKVFVTGGAGFLGTHLVEALLHKKYTIFVLVKHGEDVSYLEQLGVSYIFGDLLAKETYQAFIPRGSIVIHAAALTPGYKERRENYFHVNVLGTETLLAACADKKIAKFVFISSGSVYGFSSSLQPLKEQDHLFPDSFYGESKLAAEKVVLNFCQKYKIPYIILRPFVFFGERMPQRCGGATLFKMVRKSFIPYVTGFSGFYDYCYVKNIASGIVLALAAKNVIYNLSNLQKYRFVELVRFVRDEVHPSGILVPMPSFLARAVGILGTFFARFLGKKVLLSSRSLDLLSGKFVGDCSAIVHDFGYAEAYTLEEGVRRTNLWLKKNW